ncbi:hypothetical protein GPECTOR_40g587 [Gonium pectorale]|uniref:Ribosome biogenesis protein SLX9 n=1 Tax=Gonium pectorale TaxID=33097 RepID=A0A150GAR3_GONPE|nr:hypothetical protein GPECTOR_40g587 [Gonium pectorale]|eukprot:KXZ46853.1 hypothetical protein GPECTOR_40g587 [Gonium pectorale]
MVKKKTGGGKRYKAVADAAAQGQEPKFDGPAPPLRIQKKLTRKVNFLEKVSKSATSALATKAGGIGKKTGRKKALPDLSTLGAVLDEVSQRKAAAAAAAADGAAGADKHKKQRGAAVNSAKQRQHILLEESQRLQQVLKHPLYKADPIAAITNHLQHTLPPPPATKPARQGAAAAGAAGKKAAAKKKGSGRKGDTNRMQE